VNKMWSFRDALHEKRNHNKEVAYIQTYILDICMLVTESSEKGFKQFNCVIVVQIIKFYVMSIHKCSFNANEKK